MKIGIIEDRIGRLEKFAEFDLRSHCGVTIITGSDFNRLVLALQEKRVSIL